MAKRSYFRGIAKPLSTERLHRGGEVQDLKLAFEKLEREVLDLRPRMRQMHGACVAQREVVALADVAGGTQANGAHPGGDRRLDAAGAVFDDKTSVWTHAQLAGSKQEDIGMRFSARDHISAEDIRAEFCLQCQH